MLYDSIDMKCLQHANPQGQKAETGEEGNVECLARMSFPLCLLRVFGYYTEVEVVPHQMNQMLLKCAGSKMVHFMICEFHLKKVRKGIFILCLFYRHTCALLTVAR
jgi:hypothetical protein